MGKVKAARAASAERTAGFSSGANRSSTPPKQRLPTPQRGEADADRLMMSDVSVPSKHSLALPDAQMSQRERIVALRREWTRVKMARQRDELAARQQQDGGGPGGGGGRGQAAAAAAAAREKALPLLDKMSNAAHGTPRQSRHEGTLAKVIAALPLMLLLLLPLCSC